MQKSYMSLLALLALALIGAAGIERSASITGNGTKSLNDTWLGDKLGFSQRSLPMAPLDLSGTSVTFIGTAEMPVMLLAADDGKEDEGKSEDRAKKGDEKDKDEGAGGWDRVWDAPTLG